MALSDGSDILAERWIVVGQREGAQPVTFGPFVTELAALEWVDAEAGTRTGALYALAVCPLRLPLAAEVPSPVAYQNWREWAPRIAALRARS